MLISFLVLALVPAFHCDPANCSQTTRKVCSVLHDGGLRVKSVLVQTSLKSEKKLAFCLIRNRGCAFRKELFALDNPQPPKEVVAKKQKIFIAQIGGVFETFQILRNINILTLLH